jgi:uncharacterized membrane protein YfcA
MVGLIFLALLAGAITTVAGMGGGLVLLLGLSMFMDPLTALTVTGPGLLVGNLHRAWMYRVDIDRSLAWRFALGGAPAALVGGLVAVALPPLIIRVALLVLASLAAAKVLFGWSWKPPVSAMIPGGAAVGFVTATSGGGGLISGPLLLAAGLTGRRYVATGAVGASAIHVFRIAGYGAGGAMAEGVLLLGAVAALCIPAGNLVGSRIRDRLPEVAIPRIEIGIVLVMMVLAASGLT